MLKEAMLYKGLGEKKVHCFLCSHHCKIEESEFGFCGVRQNLEGKLYIHAYRKLIAAHIDPIEKNSFTISCRGAGLFPWPRRGAIFTAGSARTGRSLRLNPETSPVRDLWRRLPRT
jgi:hypothetical protein